MSGNKENLPRLRFPEFREDGAWEVKPLAKLISTVTPPKKLQTADYATSGNYPIIDQSQDFICGWTNDNDAIIREGFPLIIFGDHTCVLKRVEQPFAQGADGIKILDANEEISIDFLYQSLQAVPLEMKGYRRHFSLLKEKPISFPDIDTGEQQKIADCLSSLDDLITARGQKVAALERHKKGLMQQLFPATGQTTPTLRFPEFRDAGPWEEKRLGDVVAVLQGFGFPEIYQGKKDGKYPFYKVSDISNAIATGTHFIEKSANYVDDEDLVNLKARTIPSGTTIFAKIGEAIRSNRRAITTNACVIDNNTAGVKAKKGKADDTFVFYLFSRVKLIDHSGGVVPSVNKTTMENIGITCPQNPEQQKIAACLTSLDDLIRAEAQKLDALKAHKKGLMQQLFPNPDLFPEPEAET